MKYSRIPKTSLDVSQICLGTWVFGGDMWGGASEKDIHVEIKNGMLIVSGEKKSSSKEEKPNEYSGNEKERYSCRD